MDPRGAPCARAEARRRVAALVAAADLLLREAFQTKSIADATAGAVAPEALPALRQLAEALHAVRLLHDVVGRRHVTQRQRPAEVEPLDDRCVWPSNMPVNTAPTADRSGRHLFRTTQFALAELELAGNRRERRDDVSHAGRRPPPLRAPVVRR